MTLTLSGYLCRYDCELQLEKVWRNGKPIKVTSVLENELWEEHSEEIKREGEKNFVPDFGELFETIENNRYQ